MLRRILVLALLALIAFAIAYEVSTFYRVPEPPPERQGPQRLNTVVFIRPRSPVSTIARQLKEAGVLADTWKFKSLSRITRLERKLRSGEYRFFIPSSPMEALEMLASGKVVLYRVTVPEGSTMRDVVRILADQMLVRPETFGPLLVRKDLLTKFRVPGDSFEGFLFPDTYMFSKIDDPLTILKTMRDRFDRAVTPEDLGKAAESGFSLLQWVTFASMIEKETGVSAEYPLISSVFHNRLKKRMRLQSDPTVIYGIPNFNGNLTKQDLQTPTPYNTYTRTGLPPGPIANPGESALHAAANPAQTDYLYFVAKPDRTHAFARTYEEHNRNVEIFQLRRPVASGPGE